MRRYLQLLLITIDNHSGPAAKDYYMNTTKSVGSLFFENGAMRALPEILQQRREASGTGAFILVDNFFETRRHLLTLPENSRDRILFLNADTEPTTSLADKLTEDARTFFASAPGCVPCAVVGVGGGSALDLAKAVSNLLGNGGLAQDYQGWDLLPGPGIFKIGVPTISGTGAESSRTCVLIDEKTGIKLGMNSDHSIYDMLLLDPNLTSTVPPEKYFYTGMDTYIHCIESINGRKRNAMADAFSLQSLSLCYETFDARDMRSFESREKLMVASYLGGVSIAMTMVGLVHPFSAGLSIVLGMHHGVANCVALKALKDYYPEAEERMASWAACHKIDIPSGVTTGLSDDDFGRLYCSTTVHEKPLANALGPNYLQELTPNRVKEIFKRM